MRQNEDVFVFLSAITRKDKYKKFGKYFGLKKPEVFGVSVDVQAVIEDVLGV